jgi:hypothetical protein
MYPQNSRLFEAIRFGSSIPGGYWGCCAGDILQCFKSDPDEKASCESVDGDGGQPSPTAADGGSLFFGPTNKDIFLQRLRVGTFGSGEMPNHFFLAVLTRDQLDSTYGRKWLAILKENGFEFIRTVSNSVYTGQELSQPGEATENDDYCGDPECDCGSGENPEDGESLNYVFGLFRNIGQGAPVDPFTPPKEWTDLPQVKKELWQCVGSPYADEDSTKNLALQYHKSDTEIWNRIGPVKLLTEAEVVAAGAPVILAGRRSEFPQEEKSGREARTAAKKETKAAPVNAFPTSSKL